jgi:hypothetical protein
VTHQRLSRLQRRILAWLAAEEGRQQVAARTGSCDEGDRAMSRGLGALQREIVRTLNAAKIASVGYRGNGRDDQPPWDEPGWVSYRHLRVQLADGVYDLRASAAFLAQKTGHTYAGDNVVTGYYTAPSFQAAFARAVRGLVTRGVLTPLGLVPIRAWELTPEIERHLSRRGKGVYLPVYGTQIRFVSPNG